MKRLTLTLVLVVLGAAALAQPREDCERPVCAEGFTLDSETGECVQIVSS